MKKIVVGVVVLLVLLVGAILAAPVFYDVDQKLRPQIEKVAAQALNGKLSIGKMRLSLWTGVNVEIDGIKLSSLNSKKEILMAENASLKIPFENLFGGKLSANLVLNRPSINVSKGSDGKFNFQSLIKVDATASAQAKPEPGADSEGTDLNFLSKVDINLKIVEAELSFEDLTSGLKTKVDSLNLDLTNVGFGKDIGLEIQSNLDLAPNKDILAKGSISVSGSSRVDWGDKNFSKISSDLTVDLTQVQAKIKGLMNKPSGTPLKLDLMATAGPKSAKIEKLDFVVNDLRLRSTANVSSFNPLVYEIKLNSNAMDLYQWQKILVPVGQFSLTGKLNMNLKLSSPGKGFRYSGQVLLADGGASVPGVNKRITAIKADLGIENNKLKIKEIAGLVGSSSFNLNGSLNDFTSPKISLGLYSPNISAFDFIAPATETQKQAKIAAAKESQPELTEAQIQQMIMGPIDQLKKIPIFRKLKLNAKVKIDKLFYDQIELRSFESDLSYAGLVFRLKKMQFDAFSGKMAAVTNIDISGKKPKYNLKAKLAGLDTKAVTDVFVADLAGSITGKLGGDFSISGVGASKKDLKANLKGSGGFDLRDGTWSGLKAMEMAGKKLASIKGAEKEASKVKIGNKFKTFNGNFTIGRGRLNLTNFTMDLLEARTAIIGKGFVDFDLNTNIVASILAPFDKPPKKIRYKDGRAQLPVEISGKITAPKIAWEKMLRLVLGAYAEREVKKEVKKKVDQEVQKLLKNKSAQDLLKKLGL